MYIMIIHLTLVSRHATERAMQRAIPAQVIAAIHSYGSPSHHRGAIALRLDRRALDLARDDLPAPQGRELGRYRGAYVVENDATIVTVARPTRRLRR